MRQVICPGCGAVLDIYHVSEVPDGIYSFAELYGPLPVIDSLTMKDPDDEE